jgi:hypothetical protein
METSQSSVSLAWDPSSDNVGVKGYGVYVGDELVVSTQPPFATVDELVCGTSYDVAVDAYDAAGNRSARTGRAVRTSACAERPGKATARPPRGKPRWPTALSIVAPTLLLPRSIWAPMWLFQIGPRVTGPADALGASSTRSVFGATTSLPLVFAAGLSDRGIRSGSTLTQFVEKRAGINRSAAPYADWDRKRFFTLGALRLHLEWSGTSWDTWARQHPRAVLRLPF